MAKRNIIHNNFGLILFALPALLLILFMSEIPFVMNVLYSFTKWNGLAKVPTFIGFDNFREALGDLNFQSALVFTFKYSIFYVILTNIIAISLALILDKPLRSKNFFRTVFFLPNVIGLIIIGFMWRFIFSRGFEAFFNLTHWGFFNWSWLGSYQLAWISLVLVSVWQSVGYMMIIYIAGLQSIPVDVLESAEIDGAGGFQKILKIILPLLMPAVTISVFLTIANGLKVFDIIYALTGGGPGNSTTSIAINIYRESFQNNRYGFGTAEAVIFFVVILAITILQIQSFKKMEVEL
jgi:raffinose/stachyose/melibiose transport system permease protein